MKRYLFNVYNAGNFLQTVTYYRKVTKQQVKRDLIQDGLPASIIVVTRGSI